jgi:hypothetical protein
MNAIRIRRFATVAALLLAAAAFPGAASADVLDTLSPHCIASFCEGYVGDPGAVACADLAQADCLTRQNCWWRDTTAQNALAESAATDFGGQLLHPYSGSYSGKAVDVWVWNGLEGTNVILVVSGTQYFQIGNGVSDLVRDEALAAFQAGIPGFETLTAYGYLYNTAEPGVNGSTWTSDTAIPVHVAQSWVTEVQLRNLALNAHAARSAAVLGAGLSWGPDGFLGDGSLYGWDLSAPTSPQKPNSPVSETSTTTIAMDGFPIFLIPGGLPSIVTVYLPAQKVLIPGWPFGTHFPDIAPLDRAPLDPYNVVRTLNTWLSLNPNAVVPQYGPPVLGNASSMAMLTAQRDAVSYVQNETLRRMNLGEDVDTVAATLALPSNLADSPWNQQVATTVPGVVRGIYALRLGWYGGLPADLALKGLTPAEQAARLAGVGGTAALLTAAKSALDEKTDTGARWAAYAAHAVMVADPNGDALAAKCIYWNALRRLAFATPSARERNLFLSEIGALGDLAGTCGADDDADGTTNWLDCSPRDAGVNPGATEVCDGKDNDCNGQVDDGIAPVGTVCGSGACEATGIRSCIGGQMVDDCRTGTPMAEACNDIDDDCNGIADDGIAPVATTCGQGACEAAGTSGCIGGAWVTNCVPGTPLIEVCDGMDNDCNGAVDDDIPTVLSQCGVGACTASGTWTCVGGTLVDSCVPTAPSVELCDGMDNDCNSTVDDIAPLPTTCGVGACASTGAWACVGGTLVDSCTAGTPGFEACDGIDNDCSGVADDGIAPVPTTCGIGACTETGILACANGTWAELCVPGMPAAADATCDGIDDDCDGQTDEDYVPARCGVGACASASRCVAGVPGVCLPGSPAAEVLDGIDNDCDGIIDEGTACTANSQCATGFCADGVCCTSACGGGLAGDCLACSVAAGAAVDGTCGPAAMGTACRASAGVCDTGEACDGASTACPTDLFKSSSKVCRVSAGACDPAETCTGTSAACPADAYKPAGTVCRAASGTCDPAETCTGANVGCPANRFVPSGTTCGAGRICQNGACKKR